MFESDHDPEATQERSRALLWVGAAATLAMVVLIFVFIKAKPENQPVVTNLLRAGAPEFDAYKGKVELEITDKIVHPNMLGMAQYEIRVRVTNHGDRPLTAIELAGRMLSLDDKTLKENVSFPIPRGRAEPLPAGQSLPVSVKIDAPAKITEDMVKDLVVELRGLKFQ